MPTKQQLIDQAKILEILEKRQLDERLRYYIPNSDKHIDFHHSNASIKAFMGGNRTGKTVAGAIEAILFALGSEAKRYLDDWVPDKWVEHAEDKVGAKKKLSEIIQRHLNHKPQSGWVASVSYKLQADGCQKAIMDLLPKYEIKDVAYLSRVEGIISSITLHCGSTIGFKSYEQGYEDFQSAGKGWIWFDEEPPEAIWKEASVRQQAGIPLKRFLTMTPVHGLSWVYDLIYLNKLNNPEIYKVQIGWKDNPHLLAEQLESMSYGLTDEELRVRRDGDFVAPMGLVYKSFKPVFHVVSHFEPDKERYTFYRAFDFGFAQDHPFTTIFVAVDTDGSMYVFNELYLTETGQETTIQRVIEESRPYQYRIAYGDAARPDWIEAFNRGGIPTEKALKDVEAGIAKVQEYLAVNPVNGKPRLTISNKCQKLINEFTRYSYPKISEGDRGKRLPEKRYDDGLDALRYLVFSLTAPVYERRMGITKSYDEFGRPVYHRG